MRIHGLSKPSPLARNVARDGKSGDCAQKMYAGMARFALHGGRDVLKCPVYHMSDGWTLAESNLSNKSDRQSVHYLHAGLSRFKTHMR